MKVQKQSFYSQFKLFFVKHTSVDNVQMLGRVATAAGVSFKLSFSSLGYFALSI